MLRVSKACCSERFFGTDPNRTETSRQCRCRRESCRRVDYQSYIYPALAKNAGMPQSRVVMASLAFGGRFAGIVSGWGTPLALAIEPVH